MARHFSFARPDGSNIKSDFYKSQAPDPAHKRFAPSVEKLPPKVDLRPFMTKVEDQQQTSSCATLEWDRHYWPSAWGSFPSWPFARHGITSM